MSETSTAASLHAPSPSSAYDRDQLPAFLLAFASMHDAMCRDAARLERAAAAVASPSDAAALHGWWQRFASVIVHHHEREDDIVWPALEVQAASFVIDQAPLHEDHNALDRAMDTVDAALVALADARVDFVDARNAASAAAAAFRTLLVEHLAREEALAFPLLADTFTTEEYLELEKQLQKGTPLGHVAFELPWVLDDADARVLSHVDQILPLAFRLVLRLFWQKRYERAAAPVLAVA